jgi:hypothetical protein
MKTENRARTARELRELLLAVNEEIGKAWSEVAANDDIGSQRCSNFLEHAMDMIDEKLVLPEPEPGSRKSLTFWAKTLFHIS